MLLLKLLTGRSEENMCHYSLVTDFISLSTTSFLEHIALSYHFYVHRHPVFLATTITSLAVKCSACLNSVPFILRMESYFRVRNVWSWALLSSHGL